MGTYETVLLDKSDGVAVLTLNRPEAANTFNLQLMADGVAAVDDIRNDGSINAVIVTGAGHRHFSGGADLREMAGVIAGVITLEPPPRDFINEVERLPQPVVGAINGAAMGGGCEMALACDLRIMAEEAKIGLTEIAFGALPGGGGTQRLPRLIGPGRAKEMIYLGKRLTAQQAFEWGLVNEVVPGAELMVRAHELARELAGLARYATQAAKYLVNQGMLMDLDSALRLERRTVTTMGSPEERREAVKRAMAKMDTYKNIFAGTQLS